jgi:hypothetical protein
METEMNKTLKTACLNFESGLVDELESFAKTALDAPGTAYPAGKPVSAPGSAPAAAPKAPAPASAPGAAPPASAPGAAPPPAQKTENRTFSQKDGKWFSGDRAASDDEVRQINEYLAKQKADKPADKPVENPAKPKTDWDAVFSGGTPAERAERAAKTKAEQEAGDNSPKKPMSMGDAANQIDSRMTPRERAERDARAEGVKGQVKQTPTAKVSNPYAPTSDTGNESLRRSEEAKAKAAKAAADAKAKADAQK